MHTMPEVVGNESFEKTKVREHVTTFSEQVDNLVLQIISRPQNPVRNTNKVLISVDYLSATGKFFKKKKHKIQKKA